MVPLTEKLIVSSPEPATQSPLEVSLLPLALAMASHYL
jgi:hypothetical protein